MPMYGGDLEPTGDPATDTIDDLVRERDELRDALRQIVRNNDPKQGGMFCNFL